MKWLAFEEPQEVVSGASQSKSFSKLFTGRQANVLSSAQVTTPAKESQLFGPSCPITVAGPFQTQSLEFLGFRRKYTTSPTLRDPGATLERCNKALLNLWSL